ncbi:hypothetical protein ACWGKQ_22510 [Streptomyces sp. NPDC054770]
MGTRFGLERRTALGGALTAPAAIVAASAVPGTASAVTDGDGSPVAALRDGPFGSFGVLDGSGRPPYGHGGLGIEVADKSTSLSTPGEAVHFGNEVDFYGDPVLKLHQVGFHVFQTGENVTYGGTGVSMPNIRFEISPDLATSTAAGGAEPVIHTPEPPPAEDREVRPAVSRVC